MFTITTRPAAASARPANYMLESHVSVLARGYSHVVTVRASAKQVAGVHGVQPDAYCGIGCSITTVAPGSPGAVFCASPGGGYRAPAVMPRPLPQAYLVGGIQGPWFLENAIQWTVVLRDAGADVVLTERVGSHGGAFCQEEFPLMVAWAFGN